MKILTLVQGSPEWHAHRATSLNASDAPAMMGLSKYKTRAQLIKERATGIVPEVDDATQRRFNDGHRFEALARPLAEAIIGEDLSPVTGVNSVYEKYSASFDGITFDKKTIFEHKSLNDEIRSYTCADDLDDQYKVQIEQQFMISDAKECLFMATKFGKDDKLVEEVHFTCYPDFELRARLVAGWVQFEKDVAAYVPEAEVEKPTATAIMALPSLAVTIKGEVTTSNLPVFVSAADQFLAGIKTELETDQDFADAEANVKACKSAEDGIEQTKKAITAQATSIDEVMRTMDFYKQKLADVRLKLDKLVKSEKESRKLAMCDKARIAFNAHYTALQAEITGVRLVVQHPDFSGAIKGLKSLASMQDALDTALAHGKIEADASAKDTRAKLAWCRENAAGQSALFPDLQNLISKPMEYFTLTITSRIENQKADEAARLESERARIQAEEEWKARAKVEADQRAESFKKADIAEKILGTISESNPKTVDETAYVIGIVDIKQPRPSDAVLITSIAAIFNVTYDTAFSWVMETAERMKAKA